MVIVEVVGSGREEELERLEHRFPRRGHEDDAKAAKKYEGSIQSRESSPQELIIVHFGEMLTQ
jgi:hypothetical protein